MLALGLLKDQILKTLSLFLYETWWAALPKTLWKATDLVWITPACFYVSYKNQTKWEPAPLQVAGSILVHALGAHIHPGNLQKFN